jgi:hypothetical protein
MLSIKLIASLGQRPWVLNIRSIASLGQRPWVLNIKLTTSIIRFHNAQVMINGYAKEFDQMERRTSIDRSVEDYITWK